jgi:hypothetical protein
MSQHCKLYLSSKHVTLSCLSLPSTAMCEHNGTAQCYVIGGQKWLTQNAVILMYCCIWHLSYKQHVKAQHSLTIAALSTVTAVTDGLSFILAIGHWWWAASRFGRFICRTHSMRLCGVLFRFAGFWQQKSPPVLAWYLRSLDCPASRLFTILTELPWLALPSRTRLI